MGLKNDYPEQSITTIGKKTRHWKQAIGTYYSTEMCLSEEILALNCGYRKKVQHWLLPMDCYSILKLVMILIIYICWIKLHFWGQSFLNFKNWAVFEQNWTYPIVVKEWRHEELIFFLILHMRAVYFVVFNFLCESDKG